MIEQLYHYEELDLHYYHICHNISRLSSCLDKQVGAVLVDSDLLPLSFGFNNVKQCNASCDKTCRVIHAEAFALTRLAMGVTPYRAYINLFPCENCQLIMSMAGVREVYVFGARGNKLYSSAAGLKIYLLPDLPKLLTEYNGDRNTRAVVQGECAELITAISNFDARGDREESKAEQREEVVKEYIDVRLQGYTLQRSMPMPELNGLETKKWNKLLAKFKPMFFPNKEI